VISPFERGSPSAGKSLACALRAAHLTVMTFSSRSSSTAGRLATAVALATLVCSSAAAQGIITTVAGGGPTKTSSRSVSLEPYGVAVDRAGNVLVASEAGIFRVDRSGQLISVGDGCGQAACSALAVTGAETGALYAADTE